MKRGAKGSSLVDLDISDPTGMNDQDQPALDFDDYPQFNKVDTTGAGDTFTAAFAVMLSEKKLALGDQPLTDADYQECQLFANQAAFMTITRFGAAPAIPTREEVAQLAAMTPTINSINDNIEVNGPARNVNTQ